MTVHKRVGSNCFDYRDYSYYKLNANSKRSIRVDVYCGGSLPDCSETIGGLTTRHTIIRAHRYARRYIDRRIKRHAGYNEMHRMIRDIRPENVL